MAMATTPFSVYRDLEQGDPPLSDVAQMLRSADPGLVHAAVLHLERRLRSGDVIADLGHWISGDLFGLPGESQLVLARLAVDGFPVPTAGPPPDLPPSVRLAWLRARLLADPETLHECEGRALGWEAVSELPTARVIGAGLLARMVHSQDAMVREHALVHLREGLERGLLSRAEAHDGALALIRDSRAPIAIGAMRFLSAPWAFGLPLPELATNDGDLERDREWVALLAARHEVRRIRRLLTEDVGSRRLAPWLVAALGDAGDAADITAIVREIQDDVHRCGASGLNALLALKRRGHAADDDDVLALLDVYLRGPALDVAAVAEIASSRSDRVIAELDPFLRDGAPWSRVVALLEAFGTHGAIRRLEGIVRTEAEREGWWHAIRALGRLGIDEAETDILRRLDDEPEACLFALRYMGGAQAVRRLTERLDAQGGSMPVWAAAAATLLFELEPSSTLFGALSKRGLLSTDILEALPAHAPIAHSEPMRAIACQVGHPLRRAAVRAIGRTGGVLATDLLGSLVSDHDDDVRSDALDALRALGERLKRLGAVRPPHLASAENPGDALVADAVVRRLRDRSLDERVTIRLLDALVGLDHPRIVSVVRPYLRHSSVEVRKRAIACLAVSGPPAAPWLLPSLSKVDVPLSRQVLLALAATRARGLAARIGELLDHANMNLKKTAAEALVVSGDAAVIPKLLHWIANHDNPGFREILTRALEAILGGWHRGVLVDCLVETNSSHSRGLLVDALSGELSAADVATLVQTRSPASPEAQSWSVALLQRIYAGEFVLRGSTVTMLDAALRERGLGHRIPERAVETDGTSAWLAPALRAGERLRLALRESPLSERGIAALLGELRKANVKGQFVPTSLSRREIYALVDVYPRLDEEGQSGALHVLANTDLDAVARLRVGRLLDGAPVDAIPPALMRCKADTLTNDFARVVIDSPDAAVRDAALNTMIRAGDVELTHWLESHADSLVRYLTRKGEYESCLEWCRYHHRLPLLVRTMSDVLGTSFTLEQARALRTAHPELTGPILSELTRLGPGADDELEAIAGARSIELGVRERALTELSQRPDVRTVAGFFRSMLDDEHVSLREVAARRLVQLGEREDRVKVLEAFLDGRFRERFTIRVEHEDLPFLESAVREARGQSRVRLVELIERFDGSSKVRLLLQLWKSGDPELKEKSRDALRNAGANRVVPFVAKELDEGNASSLEVVGVTASIPEALATRFVPGDPTWQRFLERMAAGGTLHAPGLVDVVARSLDAMHDRNVALLLVRLGDWSDDEKVPSLVSALQAFLMGEDREDTVERIIETTAQLAPTSRLRVLANVGRPTDRAVVDALADLVLENTGFLASLSEPMATAVERALGKGLDGEPERARRILSYRAATAKTDTERAALVELLEHAMGHRAARVRMHAHRLLRTHAERTRYLAATRPLLRDADPSTVRSAVRVLAFGRDHDSVGEIAELLAHSNGVVREAARDGLIHLGPDAVPQLTKAMARSRPDRRGPYADVLERIQRGIKAECEDEDDDDELYLSKSRNVTVGRFPFEGSE
ncbi:HEAT repeat protein [Labilithrix luteola]|uniref:HEAT repeat protein n=1 Tax=Labilithrix luteola TaxID=1391654 RepID=A0A0K1Q706_9BACT|nr:HEAT repeat domain-containing protein [Labilithrix luteola]AKV01437.1 HEAT repeat protein [Labilithrix luteola]